MSDQKNLTLLSGRCLCGAVHYTDKNAFLYSLICHCQDCRRATGSAFKPFAGIERDRLEITQGDNHLLRYGDETNQDIHCKSCGSLLYSVVRDGAFVHVTLGTLTEEPTLRPSAHIFVGSKAAWHTITDDLPQYQAHA